MMMCLVWDIYKKYRSFVEIFVMKLPVFDCCTTVWYSIAVRFDTSKLHYTEGVVKHFRY